MQIEYSIPEFRKIELKNFCKHYCIINLKTYVERQSFALGIQIISLFLYIGTIGEMAIQSCEYHIVPQPRK